jgi:hypothetical protein
MLEISTIETKFISIIQQILINDNHELIESNYNGNPFNFVMSHNVAIIETMKDMFQIFEADNISLNFETLEDFELFLDSNNMKEIIMKTLGYNIRAYSYKPIKRY